MLNCKEPGTRGTLSDFAKNKLRERYTGENNPCFGKFGKDHPAYGKSGSWKNCKKEDHPMYGRVGEKSPCWGRTGEKHPMYGLRASKSPFAKKVRDNKTNIVYLSVKDVSNELNINYSYLTGYLRRRLKGDIFVSKYDLEYVQE